MLRSFESIVIASSGLFYPQLTEYFTGKFSIPLPARSIHHVVFPRHCSARGDEDSAHRCRGDYRQRHSGCQTAYRCHRSCSFKAVAYKVETAFNGSTLFSDEDKKELLELEITYAIYILYLES